MDSIYIKIPNQDNNIDEEKINQISKEINNKYPSVNFRSITSEYSVISDNFRIHSLDNEVDD